MLGSITYSGSGMGKNGLVKYTTFLSPVGYKAPTLCLYKAAGLLSLPIWKCGPVAPVLCIVALLSGVLPDSSNNPKLLDSIYYLITGLLCKAYSISSNVVFPYGTISTAPCL
jgi:hypothetical protein